MGPETRIPIEVVFALPEQQRVIALELPEGSTASEAVRRSGILAMFPQIDPEAMVLGVYGRKVSHTYRLCEHDRVEIYRPLTADPKEVRRQLAAEGKTMGRQRARKDENA